MSEPGTWERWVVFGPDGEPAHGRPLYESHAQARSHIGYLERLSGKLLTTWSVRRVLVTLAADQEAPRDAD